MESKEKVVVDTEEKSGEELMAEYVSQDDDYARSMGYSIYTQTAADGCCC